jgi:hypothetical protein
MAEQWSYYWLMEQTTPAPISLDPLHVPTMQSDLFRGLRGTLAEVTGMPQGGPA